MNKLKELCEKLRSYRDWSKEDNRENFLNTFDEVISLKDPLFIPEIIDCFDDKEEYSWILEEIKNSLLYLIGEKGPTMLTNNLEKFFSNSPQWCLEVVSVLFNTDTDYKNFCQSFRNLDKDFSLNFLDSLEQNSPHHHDLIEELRKELLPRGG